MAGPPRSKLARDLHPTVMTHLIDALETFLEVRLHPVDVLRLGQDREQLVVREEIQPGKDRALRLQVVAETLLYLIQQLSALPSRRSSSFFASPLGCHPHLSCAYVRRAPFSAPLYAFHQVFKRSSFPTGERSSESTNRDTPDAFPASETLTHGSYKMVEKQREDTPRSHLFIFLAEESSFGCHISCVLVGMVS